MLSSILSILLLILKIIGIILLVILALLLLILMVPIRYSFHLSAEEKEELFAEAKVSWFLFLLRCFGGYKNSKLSYDVRILGFHVISNDPEYLKQKEEKAKKKKKEEKPESPEPPEPEEIFVPPDDKAPDEVIDDPAEISEEESQNEPDEVIPEKTGEDSEELMPEDLPKIPEKEVAVPPPENPKGLITRLIEKILDILEVIWDKADGLSEKAGELSGKVEKILDTMEEYQITELLSLGIDVLLKILKHILPRSLTGWIRFGFDDPAVTGNVTALAAVLYPSYHKDFTVEPDFLNACFAGQCQGKGRIRLGFFVWILITLLLKKDVRKLIRLLLK